MEKKSFATPLTSIENNAGVNRKGEFLGGREEMAFPSWGIVERLEWWERFISYKGTPSSAHTGDFRIRGEAPGPFLVWTITPAMGHI